MGSRLEEKSNLVRKRIENHKFENEEGEEYEGSKFGGFSEYFRRKKIKLQNLDAELRAHSDKPQIFKGLVCHVNGYTQPSLNDLHVMIVQHGGGFVQYLDGKTMCTHVIAANLTPKKKEEFKRYRIVKPAWIVESIHTGKLLPWDAYMVVDEGVGQKVLGFERGQIISQANKKPQGYKEQTDTSWYTTQLNAPPLANDETQSGLLQTVTSDTNTDDDEYSIASSIENALEYVADVQQRALRQRPSQPRQLLEVRTELKTPPPSIPSLAPVDLGNKQLQTAIPVQMDGDGADRLSPAFGSRDGSEEPQRSHAVVRDSETLRSVSPSKLANMTAEEHNAVLLSDPKIRKSTVVHPDFLAQYYRESRLHHLSTWKADLKSQLQALAAEKSSSQKIKLKKLSGQRRYIMHVDFDSFFAAVSLRKYPQYKDKPCAVAHGGGSGSEIASCNYPARKYGVHNGMWMKRAQGLCPELKILPYDFPAYEDASRKFYDAILATNGIVQSVSIDEALIDISASCFAESGSDGVNRAEGSVHREQTKADEIARRLRDEVFEKTGCNVSIGIGGNILLAKVALRKAKPAGQYQLKPEEVLDFIGTLEVQNLPGVAWSIGGRLEEIGIKLVKDIREVTREKLVNTLGPKTGEKIWNYSRGIDKTEVGDQVVRKSVSAEVNWGVRFENQEQVDEFMHGLCGELQNRLVKEQVKGKQLTMKVMRRAVDAPRDPPKHLGHGKCDTFNKSTQLGIATNDSLVITKEAIAMLKSFNITPGELRGIGVQMQKLDLIKPNGEDFAESSQRRLQFKFRQQNEPADDISTNMRAEDLIHDDVKTPEKQLVTDASQPSTALRPAQTGTPSKKPINTMGTQFVMPTQVDPSVLAELPEDIRAKLVRHTKSQPQYNKATIDESTELESETASKLQSPLLALPRQSQLDPSVLEALPEDLRVEVLGIGGTPRKQGGQALLPQSPRKKRVLQPTKQPTKRKRAGGLFTGKFRGNSNNSDNPTLTQANFVSRPTAKRPHKDDGMVSFTDVEPDELDPEFLAALPADIQAEVLDQQRQARLQRAGGINLSMHQRPKASHTKKVQNRDGPSDRMMYLPPRPPKPTFTMSKLSTLHDLRDAVRAWHHEFSDEGPYNEDVDALLKYLRDVVMDEGDMSKAVGVVKWMEWIIDEDETCLKDIRTAWEHALKRVKSGVQEAVGKRGLGKVDFG